MELKKLQSRRQSQVLLSVSIARLPLGALRRKGFVLGSKMKEQGLLQAQHVDRVSVVERVEGVGENSTFGSNPFSFMSLNYLTSMKGCDLKPVEFLPILAKLCYVRNP